jgi:2'-5' RNA ligase
MRPNWFLAFPIDGSFVAALPAPPPLFRLFHPADVHLTLSFLGACGEEAAIRGLGALDWELGQRPQATLAVSLAEVVPMGPRQQYSALSALLAQGRTEAEECIGRLRDVVSDAAVGRRDTRPPKAHVTLARPARRADAAARRAGLAWASRLDLTGVSARLDRLALYTWVEGSRHAASFRIVAERPLPPSAPLADARK